MFNKGESLKVPERVPFRLTHNMVDAMGVSGYGGGFERTCCNTMRVLRANRDALMNVLETCVHDPLVEFARKGEDAKDRCGLLYMSALDLGLSPVLRTCPGMHALHPPPETQVRS